MAACLATTAQAEVCAGDCNRDGSVVVSELIAGVALGMGSSGVVCPDADADGDGQVTVGDLMKAVGSALNGCRFFAGIAALPGMPAGARLSGVSPDGTVLIGDDGQHGFRWAKGQSADIGSLQGSVFTFPVATSRGGAVVVGQTNGGLSEGFRWQDGRIERFGDSHYPTDVSADGSVLAGYHLNRSIGRNVAFRFADGVAVDLGYLRPDTHTEAWGLSADGSTVIGYGQYQLPDGTVVNEAFRWRDGVMLGLGSLRDGDRFYSVAADVSADGAVVVGTTRAARGLEAFRWEDGTMTGLGVLPGYAESIGQVVSGDGSTVFGRCQRIDVLGENETEEIFTAFVWDRVSGMRELATVLDRDFGLDVAGWSFEEVVGASADARTLIGSGTNPSGAAARWIARLGPPQH